MIKFNNDISKFKTEIGELMGKLHINGTITPEFYSSLGYQIEVNGTRFFNPLSCHYSFLLGLGEDKYRTRIGDDRYKQIEKWLVEEIIPEIKPYAKQRISSYRIKHLCEGAIGGYVSNETVKFIMAVHGVPHLDRHGEYYLNVYYPISKNANRMK